MIIKNNMIGRVVRLAPAGHHRQLHSLIGSFLSSCLRYDSLFSKQKIIPYMDLRNKVTGYHPVEDTNYRSNPWNNYFDQPEITDDKLYYFEELAQGSVVFNYDIETVVNYNNIYKKYLHIKQPILDKVDLFVKNNFTEDIVGIHIRGTDSFYDKTRPHLSLAFYKDLITEKFHDISKILLVTDSELTRKTMCEYFPDKIIHYDSQLIDFKHNKLNTAHIIDSYKNGEDVLIESILLSKCKKLLRTYSNVTKFSMVLNPELDSHFCELKFYQTKHLNYHKEYEKLNLWSRFYDVNLEPSTMAHHLEKSKEFENKKFELWTSGKIQQLDDFILQYYYGI